MDKNEKEKQRASRRLPGILKLHGLSSGSTSPSPLLTKEGKEPPLLTVEKSLPPHRSACVTCDYKLHSDFKFFRSKDHQLPSVTMMIPNPLPLHPGKVLSEIYMAEMGLNQTSLAKRCGCSPGKINEIVNGRRGISPAFAIALESALGTSAEMWVRIQAEYDLWEARLKVA